jgi:hypothetical protein
LIGSDGESRDVDRPSGGQESEDGQEVEVGLAGETADYAALGRLLRRVDESIVIPPDLGERITEPATDEADPDRR